MQKNIDKSITDEELTLSEVNIYCLCKDDLKIHCNHNCIDQSSWVSPQS